MKRLITALCLLGLILGAGVFSLLSVEEGVAELTAAAEELRDETPPEELEAGCLALLGLWEEKERTFVLFLRHDALDEVGFLLAELPALARHGEGAALESRLDGILARLEGLAGSVRPSCRNLL